MKKNFRCVTMGNAVRKVVVVPLAIVNAVVGTIAVLLGVAVILVDL